MRLVVTTPESVVVDAGDVSYVRAEDETGAFGILPRHADFLTVLAISVISWSDRTGGEHHVAVRGGVLMVRGGDLVEVATREAVGEETLDKLGDAVLERFTAEAEEEEEVRTTTAKLHMAVIRQLQRYLESGRQLTPQGMPPSLRKHSSGFERDETGEGA